MEEQCDEARALGASDHSLHVLGLLLEVDVEADALDVVEEQELADMALDRRAPADEEVEAHPNREQDRENDLVDFLLPASEVEQYLRRHRGENEDNCGNTAEAAQELAGPLILHEVETVCQIVLMHRHGASALVELHTLLSQR